MRSGLVFIFLLVSLTRIGADEFKWRSQDYKITKNGEFKSIKTHNFLCINEDNVFTEITVPVRLIDDKVEDIYGTEYSPEDMYLGDYEKENTEDYKFRRLKEIKIYIIKKGRRKLNIDVENLFGILSLDDKKDCHKKSKSTRSIRENAKKETAASKPKKKETAASKPIVKPKPKVKQIAKPKPKVKQIAKPKPKVKQIAKPKPKDYTKDLMVYIKVSSSIDSEKQQLIISKLHQYLHNRKYRDIYLSFSEKHRAIKYEGNDSSLYHLYKADNSSIRRDRNYEFDIPSLLETDTKKYKDIIVFDYLTNCRNDYAKNVTIVNIDDYRCDKKSKSRIIDLMSDNNE